MGVELDESQRAVLELPEGASAVVIGAPGSGKTETLLALAADRVHTRGYDAAELLVITGSRHSATELRDRLARELAVVTTGPLARTASSVAFELATAQARAHDAAPPRLLSGADQDLMIRELLQGHLDDGRGPVWPEQLDAVVRRLPTFRVELRELLMRATEFGVSPAELRRLGQTTGRPAWVAAADFAVEYQTVLASARGEMLGDFFDETGAVVETTLSARTLAVGYDSEREEDIVAIAGGPDKVAAIRAATFQSAFLPLPLWALSNRMRGGHSVPVELTPVRNTRRGSQPPSLSASKSALSV